MSLRQTIVTTALAVFLFAAAQAATIVNYDITGATTGSPPATWAATTVAAGTSADALSRGPGIVAAGLTNGFSSDNWTIPSPSTEALAIANGDYYQFGLDVDATHSVSITSFDTNMRRSATNAVNRFLLFMSLNDFAAAPTAGTAIASWQYLGRSNGTAPVTVTPGQWMTTDTPGQDAGNPITTQNLSGVAALQNIAPGTSVQFRLYGYSDLTGAAATNTIALGRIQGPKLTGEVVEIPEPASIWLLFMAAIAVSLGRRRG
jgi:hypothetical protein